MLIASSVDVQVTWPVAFPSASYTVVASLEGTSLLGVVAAVKSRTAAGCVVTLKNALLVNIGQSAGTLHCIATPNT